MPKIIKQKISDKIETIKKWKDEKNLYLLNQWTIDKIYDDGKVYEVKKYNLEFLGGLWRWITTVGGYVVTVEEAKNAAPNCVKDSIYKNADGDIVIFLSDDEELLLTYDWEKDKWMYKDGETNYKLDDYCSE